MDAIENTSGQPGAKLPDKLKGWNWGAFLLNWIWAIPHRAWLGLVLSLLLNIVGAIYLGVMGNELAWQNRRFADINEFKAVQKAWATWGLVLLLVGVGLGVAGAVLGLIIALGAAGASGGT